MTHNKLQAGSLHDEHRPYSASKVLQALSSSEICAGRRNWSFCTVISYIPSNILFWACQGILPALWGKRECNSTGITEEEIWASDHHFEIAPYFRKTEKAIWVCRNFSNDRKNIGWELSGLMRVKRPMVGIVDVGPPENWVRPCVFLIFKIKSLRLSSRLIKFTIRMYHGKYSQAD